VNAPHLEWKGPLTWILGSALAYIAASWMIQDRYYQLMFTLVPIWALVGVAWNIFSGYSGLISFGHAAFFGVGAYTVALLMVHFNISPWFGMVAASVAGAVTGILIGIPTFRLRGHYFALAMLACPLALLYVFEWLGFQEVTLPLKRDNPMAFMQFADQRLYVLVAVALLVGALLINLALVRSRLGMSLLAIKQNEAAAMAAGVNPLPLKFAAIAISGGLTAMAGGLYAVVLLIVTPTAVFGMLSSAQALIVTLFGGIATIAGPVIGALVLIPLGEVLHAELGGRFPGIQGVVFGAAIILVVLTAPEGIWPWLQALRINKNRKNDQIPAAPLNLNIEPFVRNATAVANASNIESEKIMTASNITVRYGGLFALKEVSFDVYLGEILGIIGPNGAGKTTLFNTLNGFVKPETGTWSLAGKSLTGLTPFEICRSGIGRTFQVVRPFSRMTVLDSVVIATFFAQPNRELAYAMAHKAIVQVGLTERASALVAGLTTVELRLMELARALAPHPKVLLLDEILAGLGSNETEHVLKVIEAIRQTGMTVIIIEHTMHAMVRLADRLVVLNHGAVCAQGDPSEVTNDPLVIEAYLGKRWSQRAKD
jgi:ABC-type branched-subunit amino acid transport system ATPase component/ABC-type branched-subunit amino acid transport system permease subunit